MFPVPPAFQRDRDPGDENPEPIVHSIFDLDVVAWRYDCLERAGYPVDMAVVLAEQADVDLHDAVELLKRGCPLTEALRILL